MTKLICPFCDHELDYEDEDIKWHILNYMGKGKRWLKSAKRNGITKESMRYFMERKNKLKDALRGISPGAP